MTTTVVRYREKGAPHRTVALATTDPARTVAQVEPLAVVGSVTVDEVPDPVPYDQPRR